MRLEKISLENFRNYEFAEVSLPSSGLIVVRGNNGQGKTNLLEAVSYLATGASFRTSSLDVMVRNGAHSAYVRGVVDRDGRELLIESEISVASRNRTQINRNALKGARKLADSVPATSFSPDDLDLVKGGPGKRRDFVDGLLAGTDEWIRSRQGEFDRILKQRNTLLRQSSGRLSEEVVLSLDVWDERLAVVSEEIGDARNTIVEELQPKIQNAYREISGRSGPAIEVSITTEWRTQDGGLGMRKTLADSRKDDLARGVTTSGPQRDDVQMTLDGLPARSHASQGEQRSLAVAAKLAGHRHMTELHGSAPVLLLDDVVSELDSERTELLLASLPVGQCFLATAASLPLSATATQEINIEHGKIIE